MSTDQFALVALAVSGISALFAGLSVFLSARQTALLATSIRELNEQTKLNRAATEASTKQAKLATILAVQGNYSTLNAQMLQDAELMNETGSTKQGIFASNIINACAAQYRLHSADIVDDLTWKADITTFRGAFRWPFVQAEWEKIKHEYEDDFQDFVEKQFVAPREPVAAITAP